MPSNNVTEGKNVVVDPSSSVNNAILGSNVKIARNCSVFGSNENILEIGEGTYIGMNSVVNGFSARVRIGKYVSIAQNVYIMADSGPNASVMMQKLFPVEKGPVIIGDHCWIGNGAIISPNVSLGRFCIVAANSFVKNSFDDFTIIGGSPARLIRMFNEDEIKVVLNSLC